ncbi:MAG: oligoribonuclease [Wenzhouxiangella sp.]|nr:MAG: oligoribonuclease [Wenzhouxiangella sp.]
MTNDKHLVWIDLEMTGLEPDRDTIIEIATIVTDEQLNEIAQGPVIAVATAPELLQAMDEWNTRTHGESGLIDRCLKSTVDMAEAERLTIAFLARHVPAGVSPMCGNSICQDRRFMARWMPELEAWFHYRNLDVSTVKELARRWAPDIAEGLVKDSSHQALEDIRDSIDELRYYRRYMGALAGNAA